MKKIRLNTKDGFGFVLDDDINDFSLRFDVIRYLKKIDGKTVYGAMIDSPSFIEFISIFENNDHSLESDDIKVSSLISQGEYDKSKQEKIYELVEKASITNGMISASSEELVLVFNDIKNTISPHINFTPYDLQWKHILYGVMNNSFANFSVPGSGKTVVSLACLLYWKLKKKIDSVVIIGPSSSFDVWEEEWEAFIKDGSWKMSSLRLADLNAKVKKKYLTVKSNNYNLLFFHPQATITKNDDILFYIRANNVAVIIDEAHYVKRVSGKWGGNIVEYSPHTKYKIVMTGTPVPNTLNDVLAYFWFLYGRAQQEKIKSAIKEIYQLEDFENYINYIKSHYVRMTKKDLGLSSITPQFENIEADSLQREMFDYVEKSDIIPLVKMIRFSQISSNPHLLNSVIEKSDLKDFGFDLDGALPMNTYNFDIPDGYISPKMKLVIDKAIDKSEKNERVIIWSAFRKTQELLKETLLKKNKNTFIYNGGVDMETRKKTIDLFRAHDDSILIASLQTLSESVSLHKHCKNALYIERTFNYVHWEQSINRIHRYGIVDEAGILVYVPQVTFYSKSIDEALTEAIAQKDMKQRAVLNERKLTEEESTILKLIKNNEAWND